VLTGKEVEVRNIRLSEAKSAYIFLFICLALVLTTKTSTRKVEASALNSVAQAAPTTALTKGKINGKIIFTSNRKDSGLKLWTMNADGSIPTQLTDESMRGPTLPSFSPTYDVGPKWSPDGTKIAFLSNRNYGIVTSDESHAIYVMNADGSDVRRVVIDLSGIKESPEIGSFEWSPDGTKFVFNAGSYGGIPEFKPTANIFTATVDGKDLVRLTNDTEVINGSANWSPDGSQITFTTYVGATSKIYVINANGSNRQAIADGSYPSWSPDGSKILFVGQGQFASCENYICDQLYVVNPDGGQLTQLTHYAASYVTPKYSPDGTKILFERNLITYYVINDPLFGGTVFNDRGHAIFVANADGSNQINISNRPDSSSAYDVQADWQPLFASANDPPPSFLGFSTRLYIATYPAPASIEITVKRSGNLNQAVSCDYQTQTDHGITAGLPSGSLNFAPGETSKTIPFSSYYDSVYKVSLFNNEGNASFVGGIKEATVIFAGLISNPVDNPAFLVRQQYYDFLSREPDPSGWDFWTNNIESCGANFQCREIKRVDTSAAYFLSSEFQQTGYLVYRIYKASYGNLPGAPVPIRFNEFMPDTQQIGKGGVVGQTGWEQLLENNKQSFTADFVARARFTAAYPASMTPAVLVDTLFSNAGVTPSASDRAAAISEFGSATDTSDTAGRARALRLVAENSTFASQELNRAFVLMEYFGYLRRSPNDLPDTDYSGYDFWLTKLNQFNGNFRSAEMVKAFIASGEYRQRFGP
jgi:Tol biopolymer transport system component